MADFRVGHGYDAHRFTGERRLILGGVSIPDAPGLAGHSDADVAVHAVIDAMLGAAGLGDIGRHFPDTDDTYKGISSLLLLKHTAGFLREAGWSVSNIDVTVIAQTPRLAPHITAMRTALASAVGIEADRVNVKATTEEGMGFTGAKEGIAAHSVCLIIK
ncbi:MAG TPA: 2-C-methyl-D-erythritol 2,4-cyclodiphosphate synthase [Candidatus Acidoferrum sp.]|nr:2-C-methyl-D-erythritol 2,4-cyclodiphosphate synthase [Candidatus Acidoferrum sp.]